jgi:hypothetical protein
VSEELRRKTFLDRPLTVTGKTKTVFATLRRFRRPESAPVEEQCELCSVSLTPDHRHLLHMSNGRIVCSCDSCALRFQDVTGGRFKLIPREVRFLSQFHLTDAEWDGLALPINLAFLFYSSPEEKVKAIYPSPAGATESLLPLSAWETILANNRALAQMESDVQALLIDRVGKKRDHYLVPIDVCFRLVGLIRVHWRGLSGGDQVWQEITEFFARLKRVAR